MKNAILMVAAMGMFGGALAAGSIGGTATTPATTTVIQPVSATVTNVCTYAVDSQENVNGRTFTQDNKNLGSYNALGATNAAVDMGNFYIFRCTSGTTWNVPSATLPGSISLTNGIFGSVPLVVNYSITTNDQLDTANGDIHSAGAVFTADAGQWRARAGSYTGELKVTVTYF